LILPMAITIHPKAMVDERAQLSDGCRVWHSEHISAGARFGDRCSLGQNVFVGNNIVIGSNTKNQRNVLGYDVVTFQDDVLSSPSTVFTRVHNPLSVVARKYEYR
jgi:UDP-2-acetamido-3-amino-2,3-dideoxy-glucuronate N-acetyltransferase